jgi:hypothetical protein
MHNGEKLPITHFIPPFGASEIDRFEAECTSDEREELERMFEVAEVIHPKQGDRVLSTSLYCWPHDPEKQRISPINLDTLQHPHPCVRNQNSWWQEYLVPLLRSLERVESPWVVRLHLAPDLEFLIPHLSHPKMEIRIMKHISTNTIPGMLWRYMPLDEEVTLMARGTDTLWPDGGVVEAMGRMLKGPNVLFRRFRPIDIDKAVYFVYRSIPGPILAKPNACVNFATAAKAWIWHQQHHLWPKEVELIGADDNIYTMPKFAMSHWARYGQDEQFLSHWLYYQVAGCGIHTVIDGNHKSGMWAKDWSYLRQECEHSVVDLI